MSETPRQTDKARRLKPFDTASGAPMFCAVVRA